jgi:hypothetical protein
MNSVPTEKSNQPKSNPVARFISRLTDAQKNFVALGLTIVIIAGLGGGVYIYQNQNYINTLLGRNKTEEKETTSNDDKPALRAAIENLNKTLSRVGNDAVLYQTINFEELPIYPQTWVEKYFNSSEIANALIGGQSADPDSDGLSNKQEYLYGSDPKNKDSLCNGKVDNTICFGRTDKENVDAGFSPLTGLELETPKKLKLKKQDFALVGKLQNSFETASKEGVDFPSLYQLSKLIDLSPELSTVKVSSVDDTVQSILDYQQFRIEILGDFANDDEFSSFTKIYELATAQEFDDYIKQYTNILTKLQSARVPQRYENAHRAYTLLFQKLVALVEHRKSGVLAGVIGSEFKEKSKQISTEMVWSYRRLNEELIKAAQASKG